MPLYEYECGACGHRFEAIRKFSDPPLEACPKCGGALRKLQSAPAFQFKGSGWYITDYAKKDESADKKADAESDKKAAAESKDSGSSGKETPAKTDAGSTPSSSTSSSESSASGSTSGSTSGPATGSPPKTS